MAVTTLRDGSTVTSNYVVMATGGLFTHPDIAALMSPVWSFVLGIRDPAVTNPAPLPPSTGPSGPAPAPHSPNCFTFGFAYDWALTDGVW